MLFRSEATDGLGRIPLLRVRLEDDAAVNLRRVVFLVLAEIVRVHRVRHVRAHEEAARDCLREGSGCGREPPEERGQQRGLRAGRRDGTDFFVIEERDGVDVLRG